MTSFRGQASSDNMTTLGGNLTALACHPTKRVDKAEEPTYLSINSGYNQIVAVKSFIVQVHAHPTLTYRRLKSHLQSWEVS
jgi:hypothetical protein